MTTGDIAGHEYVQMVKEAARIYGRVFPNTAQLMDAVDGIVADIVESDKRFDMVGGMATGAYASFLLVAHGVSDDLIEEVLFEDKKLSNIHGISGMESVYQLARITSSTLMRVSEDVSDQKLLNMLRHEISEAFNIEEVLSVQSSVFESTIRAVVRKAPEELSYISEVAVEVRDLTETLIREIEENKDGDYQAGMSRAIMQEVDKTADDDIDIITLCRTAALHFLNDGDLRGNYTTVDQLIEVLDKLGHDSIVGSSGVQKLSRLVASGKDVDFDIFDIDVMSSEDVDKLEDSISDFDIGDDFSIFGKN
jgi:hypothetical protein